MAVVDQFHDPSFALFINLTRGRQALVDRVKEADVKEEELDTLPDDAFAWPEKRAFPVHTPEHAIFSRVYRENTAGVPSHVDKTLKEACEVYGVDEALFARPKLAAAADDPEDYLLPEMRRLPCRNAEQVKVAEQKLLDGYTKLNVENRALACRRLVEKAAAHKVTLNPLMRKLAGFTVSSTDTLRRWVEARVFAAPETYKSAFQKLADGLKKLPAEVRDREQLIKVAETIHELDKKAGLQRHYDRKLPDPLLTVFNTDKLAGQGVMLGSRFMPMDRLASYPASFYGDVLGPDIVKEAGDGAGGIDPHKLAMILETLPTDMKTMLAANMR
jgi:hypothetical protein